MAGKVVHGARALFMTVPPTGAPAILGIFHNVSFGLTYDAQPAFVLGAFGPAEIGYTAQEPVNVTATGWRVMGHGPHDSLGGNVPHLQDLLMYDYLQLQILDRVTNQVIARVVDVKPTGFSETITNRQLSDITVTFVGRTIGDESTPGSPAGESEFAVAGASGAPGDPTAGSLP